MKEREKATEKIFHLLNAATNENYRLRLPMSDVADQILSIPELAILSDDQSLKLPTHKMIERLVSPVPLMSPYYGSAIEMYRLAQQDMQETNFKRVIDR